MKKALGILIVLALVAVSIPAFADDAAATPTVTFSGEFTWKAAYNDTTTDVGGVRERINLDSKIDKNNELFIQFRGENITGDAITGIYLNNALYNVKLTTDIGSALGLPVGLKLTTGYFDTYFTNWTYYSESGWEFYYGWPNKLVYLGQQKSGTAQVDASFGAVNVHVAEGLDAQNTLFGVDASFAGLGVYLAYGAYNIGVPADLGKGDLSVELNYGLPEFSGVKVGIAPYFRYSLDSAATVAYTFGASVGADYSIVHVALGYQGDAKYAFHDAIADLYLKPVDNLKVGLSAFLDGSATNVFKGIDINGAYTFGASTVRVGYAYLSTTGDSISIFADETAANGVYFIFNYKF